MPSGPLSLPVDYLRNTVAGSTTFQTWTSTASAALAKARVYVVASSSPTRPFALVEWAPGWETSKIATSTFYATGSLRLIFQADVSAEAGEQAQAEALLDNVGTILKEMVDLAGEATYLDIQRITLVEGPYLPTEDEAATRGEYLTVEFEVEFNEALV